MVWHMKQPAKRTSKRAGAGSDQRIGPEDWIRAGLILLARDGIDAVRVEPLAEQLGVTKGSFYWHFKDRAALHTAMLSTWQQVATREIIKLVEAEKPDPRRRLARLIELATANSKAARLETAMRSWAQHDLAASKALAGVDAERLDYVAHLLRDAGLDGATAAMRAKILYLMLIGSFFVASKTDLHAGPEVWSEIAKLIT
jgi:AcrR family transcriptional regulator